MFKKTSLKVKLIALFLLVGLIPVVVISFLSFYSSSRNSQEMAYDSMRMFAAVTGHSLEAFFKERQSDVKVLSTTRDVYNSMVILRDVGWDTAHPRWLERVNMLADLLPVAVKEYGYGFVFLTNPTGTVVYSTEASVIGADLSGRDYIQASLRGNANWSDLFYSGVINANAMVVSAPVLSRGTSGDIIGTLNIVFGDSLLARIVHEGLDRLGQSADAYLTDADGLLLTNTRLGQYRNDAALKESIRTRAVELLAPAISRGALNYEQVERYKSYSGNEVLGALQVVMFGKRPVGLVVEIDAAEALAGLGVMRNYMFLVGILAALAIAACGYFIALTIARPVESVTRVAKKVASGDFTVQVALDKRKDEIGQLAAAFNNMNETLRELMKKAVETATGVTQAADGLGSSVESTTSSIDQVAASAGEFASNTQQLSGNAQEMARISTEVSSRAREGEKTIMDVTAQMKEINKIVEGLRTSIQNLGKRSEEIGNIVNIITTVAGQTNLLALNAAIEAARAGEHGRGFAVVAEEVRKLAEQTAKAAEDISTLIEATQQETRQTMESMSAAVEEVRSGSEVVYGSGKIFQDIVKSVEQIAGRIQEISAAAQELSAGSEEVAASTEEQSAAMQEINATVEELRAAAGELFSALGKFRYA